MTIVELRPEGGLNAIEIARNFDQLASLLVLYGVVAADGVDSEVESFCVSVGVDDPYLIDKLSVDVGDVPEALKTLPIFTDDLPSCLLDPGEKYAGDLPVEGEVVGDLRNFCLIEFPPEVRGNMKSKALVPSWLLPGDKKNVFDECFRQGDMLGAWMSINSNGWDVSELKSAMARLADVSNDDLFKELADAWLLASDAEFVPY
ncbi:hypothetical protein Y5S_01282 [Alcanivorax nanhaiticus]|uniref:Uncharacterized protein n=2 Tax=Alcanivorax nanhaiticus TaxID=1177154 RepID=A0A095SM05_9GAMM|nr:hypothetical protein Y5S_01282 [Alcanivorax nanhaiticus]